MRDSETPRKGRRLWLRALLVVSLAMNLAVVGFVVGSQAKWGGNDRHSGPRMSRLGGPLTHALSHEDRHEIGRAMREAYKGNDAARAEKRAVLEALVADLGAESFDREQIAGHFARQRNMMCERMAHGQGLLLQHLEQMSPDERAAYVARLREKMQRWQQHK